MHTVTRTSRDHNSACVYRCEECGCDFAGDTPERIDNVVVCVWRQVVERAQDVETPALVLEDLTCIREQTDSQRWLVRRS